MIILWNKFDFFLIINDSFFINRLIVNFSWWSLVFFSNKFFSIFSWSNNFRMVDNFSFLLLNIQNLFNYFFSWLNVFFSDCGSSRNSYWNRSSYCLIINYRSIFNLFGINRSIDFLSSDNWSLNNFLFDNRLWYNFSSDDRLRNNSSFDKWLRNDLLSLNYLRFWIKNLFIIFSLSCHCTGCLICSLSSLYSCCLGSSLLWTILLISSIGLLVDLNFLQLTWFN